MARNRYIKRTTLSIIFFYLFSFLAAQDIDYLPITNLNFANFQSDTLWYDPASSLLSPFFIRFNAVVESKSERINILHIGGSHVQAGTLSHQIRKDILMTFPDMIAGRGMIFPYAAAKKCNNPHDYTVTPSRSFDLTRNVEKKLSKPLGVTGIAVSAADTSADILIRLTDADLVFNIEKIVLLGYADSGQVIPSIRIDTMLYFPVDVDSVLHRYTYMTSIICDSFQIVFPCHRHSRFTLTGILLDNNQPGISFHSVGVNGASVSSFLNCSYFEQDLQLICPDLVIFGLGINDASGKDFDTVAFKNNYLKLVDIIHRVNPECAFIFITNNDSYKKISRSKYTVNSNGIYARDVFYRLAAITRGAVWDQFQIMGGLKSMEKWRLEKLAQNDRIHFTAKGYQLLGNLFFNAFLHARNNILDKNYLNNNAIIK